MKTITYTPKGVCSRFYEITLNGDIITEIKITGGCNGNLQGLASLLKGMDKNEAVKKLSGIKCGFKNTSCPDQISKALSGYNKDEAP